MPYKIALDGENLGKTNCIPFFLQHHSDNLVRFVNPSNAGSTMHCPATKCLDPINLECLQNRDKID